MKSLFPITLLLIFLNACSSNDTLPGSTHRVTIQPIVIHEDDGSNPARIEIPEEIVDKCYALANVDFKYLEPTHYNSSKILNGKVNLDQSVAVLRKAGMLDKTKDDIIHLIFINQIKGQPRKNMGRGLMNGPICFIVLTPETQLDVQSFVLAHEVGHNLGLKHIVDDPNIPNDLTPNIMGEGDFMDRVGPKAMNDYQIKEIHKSRFVKPIK